jgi:uncharacterized membrane protein
MKWSIKREIFPILFIIAMGAVALYYYPQLPDPMPSHFNYKGMIDGWMSKDGYMIVFFNLIVGSYLLLTFIPFLYPLWKKISSKYSVILLLRDVIIVFLGFVFILSIVASFEGQLRIHLVGIGLGLLFIVLGNYMPKLPRNWFIGIRTPWTLSSDVIWKKTHILGGWLCALSGIVLIILSLLKVNPLFGILLSLIPTVIISGFIYPYYLFKKEKNTIGLKSQIK